MRRHVRAPTADASIARWLRPVAWMLIGGLIGGASVLSFAFSGDQQVDANRTAMQVAELETHLSALDEMALQIKSLERQSQDTQVELARSIGIVEARLTEYGALVDQMLPANLRDELEILRRSTPSVGGPSSSEPLGVSDGKSDGLLGQAKQLAETIDTRISQTLLLTLMLQQKGDKNVTLGATDSPVKWGWQTSPYGWRTHPVTGKRGWHAGVDYAAPPNTAVVSVDRGVVVFTGERPAYGKVVEIAHLDGHRTLYAHNSEILVSRSEIVEAGQAIAKVGSSGRTTGPHVHFEVRKSGRTMDPLEYFSQR